MEILVLLIRVGVTLGFLWLVARLAGRRNLGDTGPLDLLVALILGSVASRVVISQSSLAEGFLMLGLLAWLHLLVSAVLQNSRSLQRLAWGRPAVLVENGKVNKAALARERMTSRQLETLLHEAGAPRLGEVRELRLEPDDRVSVVRQRQVHMAIGEANVIEQGGEPWQRAA